MVLAAFHVDQLNTAEWAGVLSTLFAALAAAFALWTALQNRSLIKASLEPALAAVFLMGGRSHPMMEVRNGGGGLASVVEFVWAIGDSKVAGHCAAFLAAGECSRVAAALPFEPESFGGLACKAPNGDWYAWSFDGHACRVRRRPWRRSPRLDLAECVREWYPALGLDRLTDVEVKIIRPFSQAPASSAFPKTVHPSLAEEQAQESGAQLREG